MTIAADVILTGIDEPVRFNMECKARIFHEHERFWYVSRRPVVEKYFLTARVCFHGAIYKKYNQNRMALQHQWMM